MSSESTKAGAPRPATMWWVTAAGALGIGFFALHTHAYLSSIAAIAFAVLTIFALVWKRIRVVLIPLLLILFADGILWPIGFFLARKSGALDDPHLSTIYKDKPWGRALWLEYDKAMFSDDFVAHLGWRHTDYAGKLLNIEHGLRRTHQAVSDKPCTRKLAVIGGSVVWGYGARDEFTIPSELARLSGEHGTCVQVENRGETAFTSWQSILDLERELALGHVPDVVVLYSGANDFTMTGIYPFEPIPHWRIDEYEAWFDASIGKRNPLMAAVLAYKSHSMVAFVARVLKIRGMAPLQGLTLNEMEDRIYAQLRASKRALDALAKGYGFRAYFFLNGEVSTKNPRTPTEDELMKSDWYPNRAIMLDNIVRRSKSDGFYDLSDSLDGMEGEVFLDIVHFTEAGNVKVAADIFEVLARDGVLATPQPPQ